VILPTGEVMIVGGVENPDDDDTAVAEPEMLVNDGGNWRWSTDVYAPSTIPRNYHSTALLMPDGSVWTGGSNIDAKPGPESQRRLEFEIYQPWYWCARRPEIMAAPAATRPRQRLIVRTHAEEDITRLALVRCGSVTHAFNGDQRYIGLRPIRTRSDEYVGILPGSDIAVPGWYLLFVCTEAGIPSRGKFIKVMTQ
jgi:hypothetical protein